jgi:hypothetical protein
MLERWHVKATQGHTLKDMPEALCRITLRFVLHVCNEKSLEVQLDKIPQTLQTCSSNWHYVLSYIFCFL